ncbi:MAG: glycoside hydrolase family 9 protein, partial [Eubacteriales bacterium]
MNTQLLTNHIGYLPEGGKHFVIKYPKSMTFSIINRWDNQTVFEGTLKAVYGGDIDEAFVGNFSGVTGEGTYLIKCGDAVSNAIVIHKKPYEMALRTIYTYFQTQRCGDSTTGWNSPCHLKPVKDIHTGELKDMTGGWHQSC